MKISYVQHFKNSMKVIASINLNASVVRIIKASIYSDVLHDLPFTKHDLQFIFIILSRFHNVIMCNSQQDMLV